MTRWKAWTAAALIFAAGAVAGATGQEAYERWERGHARVNPQLILMKKLDRELALTPEQRARIEPIVADVYCEFVDLRNSTLPEVNRIVARGAERIREVLRPDQRDAFNNVLAETTRRWGTPRTCERPNKSP